MNRWITSALALAVLSPAMAIAQQMLATQPPQYSHAELKEMIRDAHTAKQYQALAEYYKAKQQSYRERAQVEWSEAIRRSQIDFGLAEKYPRPVDSSVNRHEYFSYEARQMAKKASYFEQLSRAASN